MRFRAELHNCKLLLDILTALSHIGQYIVITLSDINMRGCIDLSKGYGTEMITSEQCYFELSILALFNNFRIESRRPNNSIMLLCNISNLIQAIRSVDSASQVTVKLSKHDDIAWLQFIGIDSATYISQQNNTQQQSTGNTVKQEIPVVNIYLSEDKVDFYKDMCNEPALSAPLVKIMMPPLKKLLNLLDTMKQLGHNTIKLAMSTNGTMTITSNEHDDSNDLLTPMSTHFSRLSITSNNNNLNDNSQPSGTVAAGILQIKRLHNVLHCKILNATHCVGCITKEGAFVLYVKLVGRESGSLTYYVPLVVGE